MKNVRAKLNAIADGAEFLRLLEHAHPHALAAERQRGRKSAQTSTDNEDGIVPWTCISSRRPLCAGLSCISIMKNGKECNPGVSLRAKRSNLERQAESHRDCFVGLPASSQ